MVAAGAACDQGKQHDEPVAVGPGVRLIDANILHGPLAASGRIELSFDRLLLPVTVVRQTFVLETVQGARVSGLTPSVAYDPAARVVTLTPLPEQRFDPGQTYRLVISRPTSASDTNGLRAIDGAGLASSSTTTLTFEIAADGGGVGTPPAVPTVDFCSNILPMLQSKCQGASCHGGVPSTALPAEGLLLTQPQGVLSTAIGRVSEESNTGAKAGTGAQASLLFVQDMPIVDPGPLGAMSTSAATSSSTSASSGGDAGGIPGDGGGRDAAAGDGGSDAATGDGGRDAGAPDGGGDAAAEAGAADAGTAASAEAGSIAAIVGDPGHSWLMYKLLMAAPPACSSTPGAAACDGGAGDAASYYTVSCGTDAAPCPQPLPDGERAILANMVIGREMPYPIGIASGTANPQAMTTSELELVSLWIAQGARVSTSCQ